MPDQTLSTQIPQMQDGQIQLLSRMAAALADQNQQIAKVTWLPSAARTTYQFISLTVPAGVVGIVIRLNVTVAPGVDTLQVQLLDSETLSFIAATTSSAAAGWQYVCVKTGAAHTSTTSTNVFSVNPGLSNSIVVAIAPSAASSFTYSASYTWLKK